MNDFYIVWNKEEYVGTFFCGAFTTQQLAEDHIAALYKYDFDQHVAHKKFLPEEFHKYTSSRNLSWTIYSPNPPPPIFVDDFN